MAYQEILAIDVDSTPSFDNYWTIANSTNQKLASYLNNPNLQGNYFLVGDSAIGKSHLLQAIYANNKSRNKYIDLLNSTSSQQLNSYESLNRGAIVLVDHVDQIAVESDLQQALFRLFNRCSVATTALLIAGRKVPHRLNVTLDDLQSRLHSMELLSLESMNDEQKFQALKFRARRQGLLFDDKTLNFLMVRSSRDFKVLMDYLAQFSREGLRHQKKLSISLIKQTLNW